MLDGEYVSILSGGDVLTEAVLRRGKGVVVVVLHGLFIDDFILPLFIHFMLFVSKVVCLLSYGNVDDFFCKRSVPVDIWLLIDDSASKYSVLLFLDEFIIYHLLKDVFSFMLIVFIMRAGHLSGFLMRYTLDYARMICLCFFLYMAGGKNTS